MIGCLFVITVTTSIHKSADPGNDTWRIHTCVIDLGTQESPLMFSLATAYPSADAAHAASRAEALERIRAHGYELEDGIVWELQAIP